MRIGDVVIVLVGAGMLAAGAALATFTNENMIRPSSVAVMIIRLVVFTS